MRIQRSIPVLVASFACVALLTGCGVAGTQFSPGVAAQVGDTTITTRHLDSITDGYCQAILDVSDDQGASQQQIPLRYLAHEFATDLVIKAATEQLATSYDVTPSDAYRTGLSNLEPQIAGLSQHEKDSVLEIEGAQAYYQDVLTQIGGKVLADQGNTSGTDSDKATAGQKVLADWVAEHDVDVNPKYAFSFGTAGQVDTDTSFAVSKLATQGLLAQPDNTYAETLPDNLVCGG